MEERWWGQEEHIWYGNANQDGQGQWWMSNVWGQWVEWTWSDWQLLQVDMNYINTSTSLLELNNKKERKKNVLLKASLSSSIFLTSPSPSWILNILIHPRLVASSKANLGTFCTDHGLDRAPNPSGFEGPREARTGRLVENWRDTAGFRRIRVGAESDIMVFKDAR